MKNKMKKIINIASVIAALVGVGVIIAKRAKSA
jgi:hypothetical protein